ncbi:hypothetical protein [Alkalibacterium sp. 20]|uniref:hypothetical protein n=1 Tax=Alkalibacterium sp. 20 TaxID=1798803 RepID=UPI003527B65F
MVRRVKYEKEREIAHGEFSQWLEEVGINDREANRMMKMANELPNLSTLSNLGSTALYLVAALTEEEREKNIKHSLEN